MPDLEVIAMDRPQTGRVIVGLHHSLAAYSALRYAVAEARRREAALLIVRAYGRASVQALPEVTLLREALMEAGTAFAEALGVVPRDLTVQILTHAAEPGPCLVATADRDTDILVIGGSARSRLLGRRARIAAYCASHATCPVVIVPPPELTRTARPRQLERAAARSAEGFITVAGPQTSRDRTEEVS